MKHDSLVVPAENFREQRNIWKGSPVLPDELFQTKILVPFLQSHTEIFSIGSLSKDVFERRTSIGSEAFSLFIYLGANKFVLLSFFSLIKTIYQRVSTKPLPNDAKSPLPVDVRRSKTPLLKLPNNKWCALVIWTSVILAGNRDSRRHPTTVRPVSGLRRPFSVKLNWFVQMANALPDEIYQSWILVMPL